MGLEVVNNIGDLNPAWPLGTDPKSQGDDHLRNVKGAIVTDLGSLAGPLTATAAELNSFEARIAALESTPPPSLGFLAGVVCGGPSATLALPWHACTGLSLLTAEWPDLHAVIGYMYGGTGANFSVPDYRGEFLRATDEGRGADPDRAARTNRGDGTVGDTVGTRQGHQYLSHAHQYLGVTGGPLAGGGGFAGTMTPTGASGGNETRGRNVNIRWYIYGGERVV